MTAADAKLYQRLTAIRLDVQDAKDTLHSFYTKTCACDRGGSLCAFHAAVNNHLLAALNSLALANQALESEQ